jgi:hypothetical protein
MPFEVIPMLKNCGERGEIRPSQLLTYLKGRPYGRAMETGEYVAVVIVTFSTALVACIGFWWLFLRFIAK